MSSCEKNTKIPKTNRFVWSVRVDIICQNNVLTVFLKFFNFNQFCLKGRKEEGEKWGNGQAVDREGRGEGSRGRERKSSTCKGGKRGGEEEREGKNGEEERVNVGGGRSGEFAFV